MASFETLQQLAKHPEWIAPRSDVRVFLGEPGAPEATKTTVEPGNAFSPGMMSFGVTWWLRFPDSDTFFAPELAALETLNWHYTEGYLPVINCSATIDNLMVKHKLFQDGSASRRDEAVMAQLKLTNQTNQTRNIQVFIVLRSLGPAGGPLPYLKIVSTQVRNGSDILMGLDKPPDEAGCGVGCPSEFARAGAVPDKQETHDEDGWCYALLRYDLALADGSNWAITMDCPLISRGSLHADLPNRVEPQPANFDVRLSENIASWQDRYNTIALEVPDNRFHDAFFAGLGHMMTAVVGDQARIAALSYPLPWLRDSIFIIRCFDLSGQHELARAATQYCLRNDFFGGFGAEGDAPGQGIWAIVQHYLVTHDLPWLREAYPAIRRKVEWLYRMRRTAEPIQTTVDTPVLAFTHAARNSGVICVASQDGIIHGVMDHGIDYSLGWINQWALCGLEQAALAADALGLVADATAFLVEATELRASLQKYAEEHPDYFQYARTMNSIIWPTHAWKKEDIKDEFDMFWCTERERDGGYQPEPYWLYFELAQAHNALLLSNRDRAWQVLDYRLDHQDLPGLYGFREGRDGVGTNNAVYGVTLINQLRGCQTFDSITPHGWSQSELWLLQRAMLVTEEANRLRLFTGVPTTWMKPGHHVKFERFPTQYGVIDASLEVETDGHYIVTINGVRAGVQIVIDLPNNNYEIVSDGSRIEIERVETGD